MFIPRAVYGSMCDRFPAFMACAWIGYTRRWGLGGVTVRNPDRALRAVVAQCGGAPDAGPHPATRA